MYCVSLGRELLFKSVLAGVTTDFPRYSSASPVGCVLILNSYGARCSILGSVFHQVCLSEDSVLVILACSRRSLGFTLEWLGQGH